MEEVKWEDVKKSVEAVAAEAEKLAKEVVGKTLEAATEMLQKAGVSWHRADQAHTADVRADRVVLNVKDGVVENATVG